jgi:DNA-binding response OmpR family regulator
LMITNEAQAEEALQVTITAVKTLSPAMGDLLMPHTVLLVEDEASLRDIMQRTLESAGHVVVALQDGAQVLEAALGLLPDLIILDMRLPNVDGWSLLEQLKAHHDTMTIPVIVSTAGEDKQRSIELGASMFVRKPFSSDELLACVEQLLPDPAAANSDKL